MYRFLSPRPLHYYSYPNLCYRYYDNNNESYSKAGRDPNNNYTSKKRANKYPNNKDTVVKMPKLPHSCVVASDRYSVSDHFANDFCNVTVKRRLTTTTTSAYAPPLTEQKLIIKVQQRFF